MVPLPGGPSDKAGNSYERRWTVFAAIDLLDGTAELLRIEVPGDEGVGSEFRLTTDRGPEWHQAKRQRSSGPWTIYALVAESVVQPWQANLARGEHCVFVSSTSADELRELTERAQSAQNWNEFNDQFLKAQGVRDNYDRLRRSWDDPPDDSVFKLLQNIRVSTIGEFDLVRWIDHRLKSICGGADPSTVAAVLGQMMDDSVHREISAEDVWLYLGRHGITPLNLGEDAVLLKKVARTASTFLTRTKPLLIGGKEIERSEARIAIEHTNTVGRVVLAGAAGSGKTAITAQVVALALAEGWPVLVLSADRLPEAATAAQLGHKIGLPGSPSTVLAGVSKGERALLVIDQLDALSVVSGRNSERIDLVDELLAEATSFPNVRVVLACRQFDINNDRTLRALTQGDDATTVSIGALSDEQIRSALKAAGLSTHLSDPLMKLLSLPLHTALYIELATSGASDLGSVITLSQLYDRYWTAKRAACRDTRSGQDDWTMVIDRLVDRMSKFRELAAPIALLDDLDHQVSVMLSEGVLVAADGQVGLFHETFFDYCFARQFLRSGSTVETLLTGSDQDLFRRAQVRQLLMYERAVDVSTYLADFAWIVQSSDVRIHIKALVISLLETVDEPLTAEWAAVSAIAADQDSPLHPYLWQAIRSNPSWFSVLDELGVWAAMLQEESEVVDHALWVLSGIAGEHGGRLRELLLNLSPDAWQRCRRGFLMMAGVHRSHELFELLKDAVREGDFDDHRGGLSVLFHRLAKAQARWGAELLGEVSRRSSDSNGPSSIFDPDQRHSSGVRYLKDEVRSIATSASSEYLHQLLPELVRAMKQNSRPDWSSTELVADALWSHRTFRADSALSDNLFSGAETALGALAKSAPDEVAPHLDLLRKLPYEAAAILLAKGYAGNPAHFADDAIAWLDETPGARYLGYSDAPAWLSRELIEAVSSACSSTALERLVDSLLSFTPPHERTYGTIRHRENTELCLLNGLKMDRRPPRATRRLEELRRKFDIDDVSPPRRITGVVSPSIPQERAELMTDDQWRGAFARDYSADSDWNGGKLVGDSGTQAQVLESVTKKDPTRFARLLLTLDSDTENAYVSAILRGLRDSRLDGDLLLSVCRHGAAIASSEPNRWLIYLIEGHAADTLDDELIEIVAQIAMNDPDPENSNGGEKQAGRDLDFTALNSTRGAAALCISHLLNKDPGRLANLETALQALVIDPAHEVRAAAVGALAAVLEADSALAMELFDAAIENAPEELHGSQYVTHFLNDAVRTGRYSSLDTRIQAMVGLSDERARQTAAGLIALASFQDPAVDPDADLVLQHDDPIVRAAAVGVFANNITYAPRRSRSIDVVAAAFKDSAESVRDEASRAFYQLDGEPLGDYSQMIAAFASSEALADGAAAVLHSLESSRQPLPIVVLDVCEAIVLLHRSEISDIRTAAAGDVNYVVKLVLRMNAQYDTADVRRRCLDLVDELVSLRAYGIDEDLNAIER